MSQLFILILAVTLAVITIVMTVLFVKQAQLQSTIAQLQDSLKKADIKTTQLQSELKEVRLSSIGMGKAIQLFKSSIKDIDARQVELELQDPESKLYSKAAKMVEKGASIEEIMEECEIPRAEAELVISMRNS